MNTVEDHDNESVAHEAQTQGHRFARLVERQGC